MRYALLLIFASSFLSTLSAGESERLDVSFTYSKAHLTSPEGAKQVLEDLILVGRKACKVAYVDERLQARTLDRDCLDAFLRDAVIKIDAPALWSEYNKKFG